MDNHPQTVVLDFYSDTCAPCKLLGRDLDEISKDFSNIKFQKLNIMDNYDLLEKYNVTSVPTLVVLKSEIPSGRYTGYKGKEDLKKFLSDSTAS